MNLEDALQPKPVRLGKVSLVGAGPGDPDLLTVKAVRLLSEADLVLYDALVDSSVVALAPQARRFCVGKRGGRPSMKQETIHTLMVRGARRGQHVVRLKGGDPFLFGRGGEELLALADAGIVAEYVPGVSSVIAGPGLAGIPVTHREVSRGLLVVTAVPDTTWRDVLSRVLPRGLTVVVLMGLAARVEIVRHVLLAGWDPSLPVAVVYGASKAGAHHDRLTLGGLLVYQVPEKCKDLPAMLVFGDVIAVSHQIDSATETMQLQELHRAYA